MGYFGRFEATGFCPSPLLVRLLLLLPALAVAEAELAVGRRPFILPTFPLFPSSSSPDRFEAVAKLLVLHPRFEGGADLL